MHQRHVGCENAAKSSDREDDAIKVSSSSGDVKTRRRRRHSAQAWWPFQSRANPAKRSRTTPNILALLDVDHLATLLQVISVLIMVGCAVTLLSHSLSHRGGEEDINRGGSSWLAAWDLFRWSTKIVSAIPAVEGAHPYGVGLSAHYPKIPMKESTYYTIPDSMSHVGDKSDRYALLRKEYDGKEAKLPLPLREHEYKPITTDHGHAIPYDIFNCPEEPPDGYPYGWNLLEILKAWPPDDPHPRPEVYQAFCVFDFEKDQEKARNYREEELPFVVRNDPDVLRTVKRWNDPEYMHRMLGEVRHRAEYSESNHFMYWNPPSRGKKKKNRDRGLKEWKQPTEMIRMTYQEWLDKANTTDDSQLGPEMPHWYFRLIGCGETGPEGQCDRGSSEYLFDELTFFQPKDTLYMVEPEEQKGIHCRFGMRGVIAENHFDGSRNAIALLGGERRYILSHPDQCPFLSLLPKGHPSARHSAVDWSNPDLDTYPEFSMAKANEVVMQGKKKKPMLGVAACYDTQGTVHQKFV
jgi:hypothetical protein